MDEEREVLLGIFDALSEIAHEYGNEHDFGKWYYKRVIERQNVEICVTNKETGEYGCIWKRFGYAMNSVNLSVLEEFLNEVVGL